MMKYDPSTAERVGLTDSNLQNAFNIISARGYDPHSLDSVFNIVLDGYSRDSLSLLYSYYQGPLFKQFDSISYASSTVTEDSVLSYAHRNDISPKRVKLISQLDSFSNASNILHAIVRVHSIISQSLYFRVRFGKYFPDDETQNQIIHSVDSTVTISRVRTWYTATSLYQWRNVDDATLEKVIAYQSRPLNQFSRSVHIQLILSVLNYMFSRFDK